MMEGVKKGIAEIKKNYIKCDKCPAERNCCVFSENIIHYFYSGQMSSMFSHEKICEMVESGIAIFNPEKDWYLFKNSKCPNLDESFKCKIHGKKEELGLSACINFPIDSVSYEDSLKKYYIVVDYRCFSVEKNWEKISGDLAKISKKFKDQVCIDVKFFTKNGFYKNDIDFFNFLRDSNLIQ